MPPMPHLTKQDYDFHYEWLLNQWVVKLSAGWCGGSWFPGCGSVAVCVGDGVGGAVGAVVWQCGLVMVWVV